jgi:ketohexokinase
MNILGVGVAALDVIFITEGYPQEDDEVRALGQRFQRGGNVCNSLVVLSQLDHQCRWLGSLANDYAASIIQQDLNRFKIDTSDCVIYNDGTSPTSFITLNQKSGSRTIIHYRELAEFSFENFKSTNFNRVQWCHFEGRNISELTKMLHYLKNNFPHIPYSIEIEKPRPQIEDIIEGAEIAIFSQKYASEKGFHSAEALLRHFAANHADSKLVCTWGQQGAYGLDKQQQIIHQPAESLSQVVDTVGAGDTFVSGFLHQWWNTHDLSKSLKFASTLAAKKCSQYGFAGLVE